MIYGYKLRVLDIKLLENVEAVHWYIPSLTYNQPPSQEGNVITSTTLKNMCQWLFAWVPSEHSPSVRSRARCCNAMMWRTTLMWRTTFLWRATLMCRTTSKLSARRCVLQSVRWWQQGRWDWRLRWSYPSPLEPCWRPLRLRHRRQRLCRHLPRACLQHTICFFSPKI